MSFESELKKGNFVVTYCTKCKRFVWPASKFCSRCFNETILKNGQKKGKIIEFCQKNDSYFCVAEFDGIKLVGRIVSGVPKENQSIQIEKCGVEDKDYFFDMKII